MKSPAINQFKKGILGFCGINLVKVTCISLIKNSSVDYRDKWLEKITLLGEKLK
ncbi:MAG: NAD(P)H dehydrogenase (quinone) [Vicingaceae bacterium]|jgi:hypothetical protein